MATRRERVVLELQDDFSGKMLRAAAAAEVLNRELNKLSGRTSNNRSLATMGRDAAAAERDVSNLGRTSQRTGSQIDTMSGRVSLLASSLAAVGPGLIPIAAIGVPAVTGLAAQFGFAAAGAGVMIGSFQGVGDALKAVNKAAIQPTVTNIDAANRAMAQISPQAQEFVTHLRSFGPELKKLRDIGAGNMFPGFTQGLDGLEKALPRVENVVGSISSALGGIGADAGKSLGSARWAPFLDFIAKEAPQALQDMAKIAGNTGHALAELWMAFDPLNDNFSTWMVNATRDLDKWAAGLSKTQGFADFVNYVQTTGPQVGATLAAISNAFVQIVQAAAPIGGPVLQVLESLAKVVGSIAGSDLGTPIFGALAAFSALNLAMKAGSNIQEKFVGFQGRMTGGFQKQQGSVRSLSADWRAYTAVQNSAQGRARATAGQLEAQRAAATRLGTSLKSVGKGAALVAGIGVAATGAADAIGLTNAASLGLTGFAVGGAVGAALGTGAGLLLDIKHSGDAFADTITRINTAAAAGDLSGFQKQVADAKKQLADLQHPSSPLDFLSDWKKKAGGVLSGDLSFGLGGVKSPVLGAAEAAGQAAIKAKQADAAARALAQGFTLTGAGARTAAMDTAQFTQSVEIMTQRLASRGSLRDLEASIDDFRASLKQAKTEAAASGEKLVVNGKINIDAKGGRTAQAGLDLIASSAIKAAEGVSSVNQRMKIIDHGRQAFIRAATSIGLTRGQARKLANQLISLGQLKPIITPRVNTGPARSAVHGLIAEITSQHPVVTIRTRKVGGIGPLLTPADGTTVPGARYPYADKVPAILAPGEEVISNRFGQADRHRDLLKAINSNRLADGGTIKALANGGTAGYAAGAGITVYFPAPTVLQQAVKAANDIAVSSANTARSAEDTRTAHLDDLHLQQQIHETQKSLAERNDKTVGTGKHKRTLKGQGSYVLQGIDRSVAAAELADQKAQLTAMRALSSAAKDARDALISARADAATSTTGGLDLFASGSASRATRDANRYVADVAAAGQVMAQLRAAGASPILLGQIKTHVEQGDAAAAVKLGRAFLAQPALLGSLNTSLSTLSTASAATAAITTDPRFLAGGKWDPTAAAPKTVQVAVGVDPNQQTQEIVRQVVHIVRGELVGS